MEYSFGFKMLLLSSVLSFQSNKITLLLSGIVIIWLVSSSNFCVQVIFFSQCVGRIAHISAMYRFRILIQGPLEEFTDSMIKTRTSSVDIVDGIRYNSVRNYFLYSLMRNPLRSEHVRNLFGQKSPNNQKIHTALRRACSPI